MKGRTARELAQHIRERLGPQGWEAAAFFYRENSDRSFYVRVGRRFPYASGKDVADLVEFTDSRTGRAWLRSQLQKGNP